MTSNQINMLRYLEDQRHNTAAESESRRSNKAREHETHRANVMNESFNRLQLLETNRHNNISEMLQESNLAESFRHNKAQEVETNRSNEAKEIEINRHNKREEEIKEATIESTVNLNEAKTIGQYIGGAVDLLGSALGWWEASKSKGKITQSANKKQGKKK